MNAYMDIAPGARVTYGGERYVITHILSLETVLAKNEQSGKSEPLKIIDLKPYEHVPSAEKVEAEELGSIPDEEWKEAERWHELLKPILNAAGRTRKSIERIAKKAGVHAATIYRKLKRFERTGRVSSLRTEKRDGGRGKSRLHEDKEAILQHVIKTEYLNKHKKDIDHTYNVLKQAFQSAGLRPPHKNTLRNRIKAIPQAIKDEARLGADIAAKKHSAYPGHFPGGALGSLFSSIS